MFEKEAEERARKLEESQTLGVCYNDEDYARNSGWNDGEVVGYEEGFKDGAEFGYNKCNEQLIKAKELLTRFVMASVYFNGKEADLVEEAEQFLKDSKEGKQE